MYDICLKNLFWRNFVKKKKIKTQNSHKWGSIQLFPIFAGLRAVVPLLENGNITRKLKNVVENVLFSGHIK